MWCGNLIIQWFSSECRFRNFAIDAKRRLGPSDRKKQYTFIPLIIQSTLLKSDQFKNPEETNLTDMFKGFRPPIPFILSSSLLFPLPPE